MRSNWLFAKAAFTKLKVNGSVIPSSKYLAKQMLKPISATKPLSVIELGAGTGSLTRIILEKLSPSSKLIIFEINKEFVEYLKKTFGNDERVMIVASDALKLNERLREIGITNVDYIISGLPLNNFSAANRNILFTEIGKCLGPKGTYIQFQYFLSNWKEIKKKFDSKIYAFEPRNFPPAFLYKCTNFK
ncbi:MAG: hypothetical protein A3B08_00235 [Candidatus Taylorbacteria bacterium RIFCSPLOWO2_01_FULL_43_44]|uniref:Ribosomal RNA adenine methylase transferase N-terminal domain-containing protein n=1 Tax=Candidatus Taylorbacteria bacterium RIFCSPHIGHO2_02_FULL_43_32b TaxID=1802306 RepID=A0A1G2MEH5_9BACT|nr:MAG: hypothetical protein A2743_00130 [Candidatus Taylorbacteria bacterium RIFCSPHIGHO2_01_FULL_43_47]OHA22223.1 MAG: hypothetical protein A3C72_04070 [Candidatus Taylorbacteria bacterium RIFCSPHIGHO2_02_FULL_43_32b]OHA29058.1 MAG: hypothetical protein A3B08_00235 [Candidatus Taylorbacteria bacterium RIFCSPLOWO2_01_FULL_43_44]